ncbi:cytochrome P450 [Streptomyces sp. CMB-StM0423]|uniref:cytochrome P450 n=1 Tax=Streptomyces sp. CMB-StM0423 TaxID=2059884 RepID=UPI000C71184A|nr:cytochrome P450 [Streptomyces sp. CMB-StM0423]AUH43861.1 cytochrome P450 [Streptomyces sp. CMB-StM0423]
MATPFLRTRPGPWPELSRIPHPRHRLPVVGDVFGVDPGRPVQDSLRMARELGPIFRRKIFGLEIVVVSGADLVAELADESRFTKRVVLAVHHLREVAGDGLFTAHSHEPNWQLGHDILAPAFTRGAMERYHPVMLAMASRLTAAWDAHTAAGTAADVSADMTKLTLETIAHTGFGYDFGSFERTEQHPFVAAMVRSLRHAQGSDVPRPFSPVKNRGPGRRGSTDAAYLTSVVDRVVRERTARADPGAQDLLGLMLNTRHPRTGERLSPENIRHQILTFLVAGHETTSGALSFALYYLSRHPEVMARARAEVDRVWGPAGEPSYRQVSKLRYVRRVLDESLRMWPTAPAFTRAARTDTLLGGVHPMRAGAWALVLIPALHRDPAVWGPDAGRFDPDRFLPERVRSRPGHVFKPFGTGERACIGRQFALHEATLVLGLLLRRYELRGDPGYRLDIAERLTLMPRGFTLAPVRRRPAAPRTAPGPAAEPAGSPG